MFGVQTNRCCHRIIILTVLSVALWLVSVRPSTTQQVATSVPVTVRQLEQQAGLIPVELRCRTAQPSAPNVIDGFECVLLNNTSKNISATNLTLSFQLASVSGDSVNDVKTLTSVALIHPDFKETYRPITPGTEKLLSLPRGEFGSAIQAIHVVLDYVEFDDGSTMGPNTSGNRMVAEIREGATIYKEWLKQKYLKGEGVSRLTLLLQSDESPAAQLGIKLGTNQETGAKAYRAYFRKHSTGPAAFEKYLRR